MVPACFLALVSLYFGCVSHKNSLLPRSTLVTALLQQPKLNKTGNEEVFFPHEKYQICCNEVYHSL